MEVGISTVLLELNCYTKSGSRNQAALICFIVNLHRNRGIIHCADDIVNLKFIDVNAPVMPDLPAVSDNVS